MSKNFKKFLTESEIKLDPNMRVGDTLRLNINAKDVVEMEITEVSETKVKAKPDYLDFDKDGDKDEPMKKALKDKEEKVDEAMSPQQEFDSERVRYGAMKKSDYDAKWKTQKSPGEWSPQQKFDSERARYGAMKKSDYDAKWKNPVKEEGKPDYLDFDKDGDKDESMKKALKDKEKVKESSFFQTLLKNAGVKTVTENDLNTKVEETNFEPRTNETSLNDIKKLSGLQTVNESEYHNIEEIIDDYPEEVEKFLNNNMSYEFEQILHDFYANNGEMPQRLVGDDAGNWITDQFERDLNYYRKTTTSEGTKNQIDEISSDLVSRAAKQADRNAYDADKAGAYKANRIHNDQADRLYAKAKEKEDKEERERAKANELRGLSGVKRRALNKMFYNAEGASKKNTFELSEGKLVYMGETYELTLDNNKRTWTANIWTTRKIR